MSILRQLQDAIRGLISSYNIFESEKKRSERTHVHRSMYLERNLYERLGEAHKIICHELYPLDVRKSTFIEACIAYALDHLTDIKTALHKDL
ncbi:MAG: hypothetical protein NVSMB27_27510 [Ktedonobacteraceae bacterium]